MFKSYSITVLLNNFLRDIRVFIDFYMCYKICMCPVYFEMYEKTINDCNKLFIKKYIYFYI